MQHILCADIGGTHSRFAHMFLEKNSLHLCAQHTCPTASLQNTQDALAAAAGVGMKPQDMHMHVWGVAGFVEQEALRAQLTNTSLCLDFSEHSWVAPRKNFLLYNDFALQAWASLAEEVEKEPIITLKDPLALSQGVRGILGAGTGFGTATFLPIQGENWHVLAAEGGHTDMPFQEAEQDFFRFACEHLQQERVSVEDVLCAQGLSLLHAYVHGEKLTPQQAAAVLWKNDTESLQAQMYARFLGRYCRHWALNTLCFGGIYLGGGVLQKNAALLHSPHFLQEFFTSPQSMQVILQKIPLFLMRHKDAALWGAAHAAKTHIVSMR